MSSLLDLAGVTALATTFGNIWLFAKGNNSMDKAVDALERANQNQADAGDNMADAIREMSERFRTAQEDIREAHNILHRLVEWFMSKDP